MTRQKSEVKNLVEIISEEFDNRRFRSKNLISCDLKGDKPIILPFGDMHYGSPEFNEPEFLKNLEWAYNTPNTYIIGMGDWLEAATRHSVGAGVYEQVTGVNEQIEQLVSWFKPFASKGRLLGVTNGNHEDRIFKGDGVDVTRIMAQMLDVPYFKNGGFFKLKCGAQNYHVYATHGKSNSTLPYTKIKRCYDLSRFIEADIYLMGHVHDEQVHTQEYLYIDNKDKMIRSKNKFFVLTGHYLNWQDGYAQQASMIPSKQGTPKLKLHSKEHRIRVSL